MWNTRSNVSSKSSSVVSEKRFETACIGLLLYEDHSSRGSLIPIILVRGKMNFPVHLDPNFPDWPTSVAQIILFLLKIGRRWAVEPCKCEGSNVYCKKMKLQMDLYTTNLVQFPKDIGVHVHGLFRQLSLLCFQLQQMAFVPEAK